MEERTTRPVYIETLTCRIIFHHLEDSISHGNEQEGDRSRGQGACPEVETNQVPSRGFRSTDLKDQG